MVKLGHWVTCSKGEQRNRMVAFPETNFFFVLSWKRTARLHVKENKTRQIGSLVGGKLVDIRGIGTSALDRGGFRWEHG